MTKNTETYTEQDYINDTTEHINLVQAFMLDFADKLKERAFVHDASKFEEPEKSIFAANTPGRDNTVFGSKEYEKHKQKVRVALDHHYAHNSHHPEHRLEGIVGMDLLDIVEMICDWSASSLKHEGSSIKKSIDINQKRFNYTDELKTILNNTVQRSALHENLEEK